MLNRINQQRRLMRGVLTYENEGGLKKRGGKPMKTLLSKRTDSMEQSLEAYRCSCTCICDGFCSCNTPAVREQMLTDIRRTTGTSTLLRNGS